MSILLFALILFALVLVHEYGHFFAAKRTGMRVDEFGIGFPPKVASVRRGETEYSLNALPIGGFVRIYGEDAAAVSTEASDRSRSFSARPKWAQALVLIAGVTANILFAWFLFALALGIGMPTSVSPEEATDAALLYVVEVLAESPAMEAGILPGAVVERLSAGEQEIAPRSSDEFRTFVEAADAPVTVAYTYRGETAETTLVPAFGLTPDAPERAVIGVGLGLVETVREPIHRALGEGFMLTVTGLRDVTVGIWSLLADALVFEADLSQVSGPVGIVGLVDDASAFGVTSLLMFTAFISLNLAVINLLPFPALDGGRLVFVAIETVFRKPIPVVFAYYVNAVGFLLLMALMVAITYNDILRLS